MFDIKDFYFTITKELLPKFLRFSETKIFEDDQKRICQILFWKCLHDHTFYVLPCLLAWHARALISWRTWFRTISSLFMHNVLGGNVRVLQLYILLARRINTFWSKSFDKFWSVGIGTFGTQKLYKKNWQNSQSFFNYINSFPKMLQLLQIIYYRHIRKTFLPFPTRFYTIFYQQK